MTEPATRTQPEQAAALQVLRMIEGYWASQVVRVMATIGLADELAAGVRRPADLAEAVNASSSAVARLLRAAAVLGLVREVEPDRFELTPTGRCLGAGRDSLRDIAVGLTDPAFWRSWEHLEHAVRSGCTPNEQAIGSDIWTYYRREQAEGARFAAAMQALASTGSSAVADACELNGVSRIVDVGGGHGQLLAELLVRAPHAHGVLLDLPDVLPAALSLLTARGVADRVELVAGDFLCETPAGGDLYLLKSVLHNWDDDAAVRILRACRQASTRDGRLLVVGHVLPEGPEPAFGHLLDLMMLVQFGGQERTREQYRALLARARWTVERVIRTAGALAIVQARCS